MWRYLMLIMLIVVMACDESPVDVQEFPIEEMTIARFSFQFDEMTYDDSNAPDSYSYTFRQDLDEIDRDVFDGGLVLAHISFRNGGAWTALPHTMSVDADNDGSVDYTYSINYAYSLERLDIFMDFSLEGVGFADSDKFYIKVVIIPPGSDFGVTLDNSSEVKFL